MVCMSMVETSSVMLMSILTTEDNVAADDKVEHYLEGFLEGDWQIDTYWDEPEGVEE